MKEAVKLRSHSDELTELIVTQTERNQKIRELDNENMKNNQQRNKRENKSNSIINSLNISLNKLIKIMNDNINLINIMNYSIYLLMYQSLKSHELKLKAAWKMDQMMIL